MKKYQDAAECRECMLRFRFAQNEEKFSARMPLAENGRECHERQTGRKEGRCRPPMAAEKRSRNRNSRPNLILSVSLACIFRFLMNKAIRLQLLPNNLQYHFLFSITSGILYFFYQIPVFFHTKSERKIMCSVFPQHPEPVHFVSHGRPASPPRTGCSSPSPCPAPGIMGQKPFPFP